MRPVFCRQFLKFGRHAFAALAIGLGMLASVPASAFDNERVALVIGNDSYPNEPLRNAANDARAMQKTLQELTPLSLPLIPMWSGNDFKG